MDDVIRRNHIGSLIKAVVSLEEQTTQLRVSVATSNWDSAREAVARLEIDVAEVKRQLPIVETGRLTDD